LPDYPESFDHMLAAWNERDPDLIRRHLEQALAIDVEFADPANFVAGINAFEQMVRAFRAERPDAICERKSGVDGHHQRYRYQWNVRTEDEILVTGFDVTSVNSDGLVVRVDGFFGPFANAGR
jgi:hypothetical protein